MSGLARATLGILGGGQLARMLAEAAQRLGVVCVVIEPGGPHCPAARFAEVLAAPFDDPRALDVLASRCDAVTVELEGVPVAALEWLAARVAVRPGPHAVAVSQDRLSEKRLFRSLGIETAPFDDEVPLAAPAIVKTRRGGYDGRGQRRVDGAAARAAACAELPEPIVEGLVPFRRELSVVGARDVSGDVRVYPLAENEHAEGILRVARAPAMGIDGLQRRAEEVFARVANALDYVGVLAIELFEVVDAQAPGGSRLVANEMAPRVHNTGHWTQHGAVTDQFEQHVRAVLGRELGCALGPVGPVRPTVMVNCIGALPASESVARWDHATVHLVDYEKAPRVARKVGHVNVVAAEGEPASVFEARVDDVRRSC